MSITIQSILESYDDNVIALALHLETILPDILIDTSLGFWESTSNLIIEALDDAKELIDDGDYLSLTDEEADDLEDERLESYIDECIIPEIPEAYQSYFDRASWKDDAHMDGRGRQARAYKCN